jgi:hypothetical protein
MLIPLLSFPRNVLRPVSLLALTSSFTPLTPSRSGKDYEFLSLSQELAAPGEMRQAQTFEFAFKNVEKQYESYSGINVKLRYFLRVTIARRMGDVVKEREIWVHSYRMPPDSNMAIKMEVGIEDCLHIEFEYNKAKYVCSACLLPRLANARLWQIPPERRHRRQNLLSPRPHQDQTHGALHHPPRDDGRATKRV